MYPLFCHITIDIWRLHDAIVDTNCRKTYSIHKSGMRCLVYTFNPGNHHWYVDFYAPDSIKCMITGKYWSYRIKQPVIVLIQQAILLMKKFQQLVNCCSYKASAK